MRLSKLIGRILYAWGIIAGVVLSSYPESTEILVWFPVIFIGLGAIWGWSDE